MFELPEFVTLARQMREVLVGKTIQCGQLGNVRHKFVWYNTSDKEFAQLAAGKTVGMAYAKGKWLFLPLDPGYVLLLGECGGKVLYHLPEAAVPKKYHLYIKFEDGSFLTALTQMWGAYELYPKGDEQNRQYVRNMRPTPIDPTFIFEYFQELVAGVKAEGNRSVKSLLT